MKNVILTIEGDILTIKVDLSNPGNPSSTGKTKIVATTGGSAKLDYAKRDVSVGLNVFAK